MGRVVALLLVVVAGLAFLSRSCTMPADGAPIAILHARVVNNTGADAAVRALTIADGRIARVSYEVDDEPLPVGAQQVDATGLYVAATTFDKTAVTLLNGIRHVWIGQLSPGDPGDVVLLRINPGRVRPGQIPDDSAIVGAVVDGVYYTSVGIRRRR